MMSASAKICGELVVNNDDDILRQLNNRRLRKVCKVCRKPIGFQRTLCILCDRKMIDREMAIFLKHLDAMNASSEE